MPASTPASAPDGGPAPRRILDAAAGLFSTRGYDAVSVNAVADAAGVSKANVFHHFRSKRELYLAVLRRACDEATAQLQTPETGAGHAARLQAFIQHHLQHVCEHAGLTRLVLRELLEDGEARGQELAEQALGESFTRLVGMVREGQAAGVLRRELDPALAALVLVGADIFFFQVQALIRHFPDVTFAEDPVRFGDMLADLLLQGMLAPPAGADPARSGAGPSK